MEIGILFITVIGAFLAGMGIGGGAIYVFLSTTFNDIPQKEAQVLNLILFVSVSLSVIIFNLKNKKINFKLITKIMPCLIIGSFFGTKLVKITSDENLKKYFTIFLMLLGAYEIISSLFFNKKTKNINNKN